MRAERIPSMRMLVASVLVCTACSGSPAPRSVAPIDGAVTARGLFCAYGGVGLAPVPTPPDFETMYVSQVFELDNPGPPLAGVTLGAASLRDAAGAPVAPMLRLDHFVDLSAEPAPDPTWGSFAVYLNGTGTPFDGTLSSGTTRLRIQYAVSGIGMSVDHCRAELSGLGATPMVIESALDGVLPSS